MLETRKDFSRAFIKATPTQLRSINIENTFITNMTCKISNVNELTNSIGPCTKCTMIHNIASNAIDEYWIPTDWLTFLNNYND